MAYDAIETPFGKTDWIVGGAATYIAYAASNFVKPINQVSIVGYDFAKEEMDELVKRGVNLEGVEDRKRQEILLLERQIPYGYEHPGYADHRPQCTRWTSTPGYPKATRGVNS